MIPDQSRYLRASRAAMATRSALAGALIVLPGLACSGGDEAAFASATTTRSAAAAVSTTAPATPTTSAPTSVSPSAVTATSAATATTAAATFPVGAELQVAFTYQPTSGGQVHNPYIAVWVEDLQGNLVQTISLWYQQSGNGSRWLNELTRWYGSGADAGTTLSGATRVAGSYTVTWNGTNLDGNPVPAGDYALHIEAARERGPYSFVSGTITVGDGGSSTVTLPDNGELSAATAALVA